MSKNNMELCTATEANEAAAKINEKLIGGGVARVYDSQDPMQGGSASIFGSTVDADDPSAHLYTIELTNGAKLNAALALATINSKINGTRWVEMLTADAQENQPRKED